MPPPRSPAAPPLALPGARAITPAQAATTLGASAAAGLALVAAPEWWVAFGVLGVAALTAFGLLRPAMFLGVFLLVRPLLDEFSQTTVGVESANLAGALGALLAAITVVVLVARRRPVVPPATGPLMGITFVSLLAAAQAASSVPSIGLRPASELIRLIALVTVFLLAANTTPRESRARALFVIVGVSAIVPALWGIWELGFGAPVKEGTEIGRISGTFTGPVPFGAFLSFTALVMIFGPVEKVPSWIRWPALVAMLIALTATYSRVGWVLFVLGLVILGWRDKKALVTGFVMVLVVVGAAIPSVRERALPSEEGTSTAAGYESYDWRLGNWEGLLGKWRERPLLGNGLESTTFVNPRAPLEGVGRPGGGFESHNLLVRILVEGGLVLLVAYLIFLVSIMRRLRRLSRERWELRDGARLLYVIWGLSFFTGLTTDDPFQLTALMVTLLGLTGAVEGAHRGRARVAAEDMVEEVGRTRRPVRPAGPFPVGAG